MTCPFKRCQDQTTHCDGAWLNETCIEKAKAGPVLGSLGLTPGVSVALSEVSHTVENLRIEEGFLVGDITVLDTPKGRDLERLLDSCDFRATGLGVIRGGHVTDYNLISIDAVLDGVKL